MHVACGIGIDDWGSEGGLKQCPSALYKHPLNVGGTCD